MERQFYIWSTFHNQWLAAAGGYTPHLDSARAVIRRDAIILCRQRNDPNLAQFFLPVDADAADEVFADAQR